MLQTVAERNEVSAKSAAVEAADTFLSRCPALFIDGEWGVARAGRSFEVLNPATGGVIGHAAEGDAADIDRAVQAARRSFDSRIWRGLTADERSRILWKVADRVEAHREELIRLEVIDNGMPWAFGEFVVQATADWFRHFARLATNVFGRNVSGAVSGAQPFHAYSAVEPVGVAGLITPWNGPVVEFALKVAPALAAGCSVVLKPAENTPFTSLRMAEILIEAGVPPGVCNVVTGYGQGAGSALVDHPDVDKISFTGSTATGKAIVKAAAGNLKRLTLELGGKSPSIVFDDADLAATIPTAGMAIFANTGQVCFAGSRLFVQRGVFDEVVEGIAAFAKSLSIGSGLDHTTALGPLISERQHSRVMEYIAAGKAEGAKLVTGGEALPGPGFFVEPTVFADVRADMRIAREEIFGPVLVATPFDDVDEVVRKANDTRYGLGAGLFTGDVNKAHLVADRLQAGNVWVNCYGLLHPALPFGGFKESGWGREAGSEGIEAFLEKKSVVIKLSA